MTGLIITFFVAVFGILSADPPQVSRPTQEHVAATSTSPGSQAPVDTMPVVLILVDFPDGRLHDGSLPSRDADTAYFSSSTINAVGSVGWILDSASSTPIFRKKIRKYCYEDYWNMIFSNGIYHDDSARNIHPHPDYASHGISVYGSMADYYKEVSYGRFLIQPAVTHSGQRDMYHTGIVNRIDTAQGKNYVHWIMLPRAKPSYGRADWSLVIDAMESVSTRHALPSTDPEHLEFDPSSFHGKIIICGAGSNIGGFSRINGQYSTVSEKAHFVPNNDPRSHFDGILQNIHEFAHTLGLPHVALGSFDPMHWGGMAPLLEFCPPHFNPVTKFRLGWLPRENIASVDSDGIITLQPSHLPLSPSVPTAAFVALSKVPGGNANYSRGEYLVIEYRTRAGFDRFSGGTTAAASGFAGGALIWHYSPVAPYPYHTSTDDIAGYLSLDIPGYSASYPHAKDQSPTDYVQPGATIDSSLNLPNTRTIGRLKSGLTLESFRVSQGRMSFKVVYSRDTTLNPDRR